MENNFSMYTEEQLMARLKFFIGVCLALTLTGIIFVILYSIIFITQPLNAISPIDQKFFEMIIPIATFLTGTLSGIMLAGGDKDLKAKAMDAANKAQPVPASLPVGGLTSAPVSAYNGGVPFSAPLVPTGQINTPTPGPIDVVVGYGGRMAPPAAPQPLI